MIAASTTSGGQNILGGSNSVIGGVVGNNNNNIVSNNGNQVVAGQTVYQMVQTPQGLVAQPIQVSIWNIFRNEYMMNGMFNLQYVLICNEVIFQCFL